MDVPVSGSGPGSGHYGDLQDLSRPRRSPRDWLDPTCFALSHISMYNTVDTTISATVKTRSRTL